MSSYIKITLIIFLLISKTGISQEKKQFKIVEYNFISTQENNLKINTKLYIKGEKSVYLYSDDVNKESNFDEQNLTFEITSSKENIFLYKDFKNNTITYKDYIFLKSFIIKDSIPKINWKIYDEEKTIANTYLCKKAVGEFRGRTYTAWFTEQIPISNGPWKLGGLPGLILEAYDKEREVVFNFLSFKKTGDAIDFNSFNSNKTISWEKFVNIYRKKFKQLIPAISSSISGNVEVNIKINKINIIEKSILEYEN